MSSMTSRLKGFGFGRKSSDSSITPGQRPPGQPGIAGGNPAPSIASSNSQQSFQQTMNHGGPGARPPSYTANYPPGPPQQGHPPPPPVGRQSPLTQPGPTRTPPTQMVGGPPPINTGAPVAGYPPPNLPMGAPPPNPGPPGYGGQPAGYPPPAPSNNNMGGGPYTRNAAAEVEGNSRSKAQLIVGIDFVSQAWSRFVHTPISKAYD